MARMVLLSLSLSLSLSRARARAHAKRVGSLGVVSIPRRSRSQIRLDFRDGGMGDGGGQGGREHPNLL